MISNSISQKMHDIHEDNGIGLLHNGASIIAAKNGIVLCKWTEEYVTWAVNENGDAYWGHYFKDDLEAAVRDFIRRSHK